MQTYLNGKQFFQNLLKQTTLNKWNLNFIKILSNYFNITEIFSRMLTLRILIQNKNAELLLIRESEASLWFTSNLRILFGKNPFSTSGYWFS